MQMHHHRSEHWVVVHGTAEVTIGSEQKLVYENQSVYIVAGQWHRLHNPGKTPLELIEVTARQLPGARMTSCAPTTSTIGRARETK